MKNFLIEHKLEKITYVLEMIITGLIAIGVIIGLINLVRYFPAIFVADARESYEIFQSFLAYALVLIVGVELMLMIINHSIKAIIELILFVIARKMLIYSHTMKDLVLGTIAIAIVFAVLKYLIPEDKEDKEDIMKRNKNIYSASAKVKDIIKRTKVNIPVDKGHTVGELVCKLADEACVSITEGSEFILGELEIKVVKASEDGLIEEVMIKKKEE